GVLPADRPGTGRGGADRGRCVWGGTGARAGGGGVTDVADACSSLTTLRPLLEHDLAVHDHVADDTVTCVGERFEAVAVAVVRETAASSSRAKERMKKSASVPAGAWRLVPFSTSSSYSLCWSIWWRRAASATTTGANPSSRRPSHTSVVFSTRADSPSIECATFEASTTATFCPLCSAMRFRHRGLSRTVSLVRGGKRDASRVSTYWMATCRWRTGALRPLNRTPDRRPNLRTACAG